MSDLDPRKDLETTGKSKILNREIFYKGQTIIEQDSSSNRAFYIESGTVEISVRENQHSVSISKLGAGEIFGEMGLISHEPRSASAKAIEDTTVTIITEDMLNKRIEAISDKAIRKLIRVLIERLTQSNKGQLLHYKNLAEFQDRVIGLMNKADTGITKSKRAAFRDEAEPLLAQLEALLDKYNS
ncbi:MAG: cyclic nucleotide-binding domain-containing protein [Pseudomonadota bacterium]|nr:cyclic nucleotide-binding domain-containing protein [Pseudomonadota bacterium]MEC8665226.1 cyclic nucleotide-binding domain-containing protein [Pseudomonadota bacterium]